MQITLKKNKTYQLKLKLSAGEKIFATSNLVESNFKEELGELSKHAINVKATKVNKDWIIRATWTGNDLTENISSDRILEISEV